MIYAEAGNLTSFVSLGSVKVEHPARFPGSNTVHHDRALIVCLGDIKTSTNKEHRADFGRHGRIKVY